MKGKERRQTLLRCVVKEDREVKKQNTNSSKRNNPTVDINDEIGDKVSQEPLLQ